MKILKHFLLSAVCVVWCLAGAAGAAVDEKDRQRIVASIDARQSEYAALARRIWELAEVGYQEEHSAAALQKTLREAGFTLEAGVAGMPTAFVASAGAGEPVIGVLAEFDALPGLSQAAVPERKPTARGAAWPCVRTPFVWHGIGRRCRGCPGMAPHARTAWNDSAVRHAC